jgi:hypothetical protein
MTAIGPQRRFAAADRPQWRANRTVEEGGPNSVGFVVRALRNIAGWLVSHEMADARSVSRASQGLTMSIMTIAAPSKFPLWRTVGQAYEGWVTNFPELLRICLPWMLLMAPILALLNWWQEPRYAESLFQPGADLSPFTVVMDFVGWLVTLPALASVAVAWHRLLLRGEHPARGAYVRLDRIVAGYASLALGLMVIKDGSQFVGSMFEFVTGVNVPPLADLIATRGSSIIALLIVARLSLALPGIALECEAATLRSAWSVTKRNTWRLLWGYIVCSLPLIAINLGISYLLFHSDHSRVVVTLAELASQLLSIPIVMINVGMLSLCYRHFFERSI